MTSPLADHHKTVSYGQKRRQRSQETSPSPQPPPWRRMSNVHPCEERRRSAPASARDVVYDGGRGGRRAPPTPAPCHMPPPNNMLIVTSLMKPDAAALKPRQHCVRRPTPATALTPRQYRWRCCPRRDGSVGHVALASSSSAARLGSEYVWYYFLLAFLRVFRVLFFYSEQGQIAWSYS